MDGELVKVAASQGLWAVLFVSLLFYVLGINEKREQRLLHCLDQLGLQFENLSRDMGEVRIDVKKLKDRVVG